MILPETPKKEHYKMLEHFLLIPSVQPKRTLTLHLYVDTVANLEAFAAANGISVNAAIRHAINTLLISALNPETNK